MLVKISFQILRHTTTICPGTINHLASNVKSVNFARTPLNTWSLQQRAVFTHSKVHLRRLVWRWGDLQGQVFQMGQTSVLPCFFFLVSKPSSPKERSKTTETGGNNLLEVGQANIQKLGLWRPWATMVTIYTTKCSWLEPLTRWPQEPRGQELSTPECPYFVGSKQHVKPLQIRSLPLSSLYRHNTNTNENMLVQSTQKVGGQCVVMHRKSLGWVYPT